MQEECERSGVRGKSRVLSFRGAAAFTQSNDRGGDLAPRAPSDPTGRWRGGTANTSLSTVASGRYDSGRMVDRRSTSTLMNYRRVCHFTTSRPKRGPTLRPTSPLERRL